MPTVYHSQYYACELTKRSASDSLARLGPSLFSAQVDLNPHQLDAALFAFRSPLSRGAILADEVGLGKTIEAGLIISQLWAERKRRILVIAPAILRKQWAQELADKFYLPSLVLEAREHGALRKAGQHPFEPADSVVLCSYQFARAQADEIAAVPWDLVVIDEAHRLRNVYKAGNKIAAAIKMAVSHRPLLLLTATPLQNSLLELYGLVSFLDEHLFGGLEAFRARYMRGPAEERHLDELRRRIRPVCQRTLRRQVTEYVRFTNRIPITQDFTPTDDEQALYDLVTAYLQRDTLAALPAGQRKLTTLVLRKLLASSTFAIAGTFRRMAERLARKDLRVAEVLETDYEGFGELTEEWSPDEEEAPEPPAEPEPAAAVRAEIRDLNTFGELAAAITVNAKGQALLQALELGFQKLVDLGARRKAVIFTESRRTQAYLMSLLNENGYSGRVLTINGTNTEPEASAIYRTWVERHLGEPVVTGNKAVDIRAALVEHFRDHAELLVATEAAAEGVNLQFCSLVVNYDLPWNPQRIEQRIGRCHRYGQEHDVVVINFLNRANAADRRVLELLSEKFRLFEGIFGSSDEVLGALESGVDFERRIAEIYQACRTPEEIDAAFAALRQELEEQISARMAETRTSLLEHFDEEVHRRLRTSLQDGRACLDHLERCLWSLTRSELDGRAEFDPDSLAFQVGPLGPDWPGAAVATVPGRFRLPPRQGDTVPGAPYHLGHPLAAAAVERAMRRILPPARVVFEYGSQRGRIGLLEELRGCSGWLALARLTVTALEREDRVLLAVLGPDGEPLHPEVGEKLFLLDGRRAGSVTPPAKRVAALRQRVYELQAEALQQIQERNSRFFDEEMDKLERWATDGKQGLEAELSNLDSEITRTRRDARGLLPRQEKVELLRQIGKLKSHWTQTRRQPRESQDGTDARAQEFLSQAEARPSGRRRGPRRAGFSFVRGELVRVAPFP